MDIVEPFTLLHLVLSRWGSVGGCALNVWLLCLALELYAALAVLDALRGSFMSGARARHALRAQPERGFRTPTERASVAPPVVPVAQHTSLTANGAISRGPRPLGSARKLLTSGQLPGQYPALTPARGLRACAGPTMAMIAYKCPEIQVVVVDINQARSTPAASAGGPHTFCSPVLAVLRELPLPSNLARIVPCLPAGRGLCTSTCWTSPLCVNVKQSSFV